MFLDSIPLNITCYLSLQYCYLLLLFRSSRFKNLIFHLLKTENEYLTQSFMMNYGKNPYGPLHSLY